MRKVLLLLAFFGMLSSVSFGQTVQKQFTLISGGTEGFTVHPGHFAQPDMEFKQAPVTPDYIDTKNNIPSFLAEPIDVVDTLFGGFITREHPYPFDENGNWITIGGLPIPDTGRVVYSRGAPAWPSPDAQPWYIGDLRVPINVVNQQGQTIFNPNGFAQFIPTIKNLFPSMISGSISLDSVRFALYSFKPVVKNFLFTTLSFPRTQWAQRPGTSMGNSDYAGLKVDLMDASDFMTEIHILTPDYINDLITFNPNGSIDFQYAKITKEQFSGMANMPIENAFGFVIFKEDPSDFTDSVGMVGTWEWANPYYDCFASTVSHFPNGSDSIWTLFSSIAPPRPLNPSDFPQIANQTVRKQNLLFFVYGTFTGVLDPDVVTVEISDEADNFSLGQNYPNPVANSTDIEFSLTQPAHVTFVVYNSLGQKVQELINKYLQPGTYKSTLDATWLPAGTYYYSIKAGNKMSTKVMQVVR